MKQNIPKLIGHCDFVKNENIVKIKLTEYQGLCNTTYTFTTKERKYILKTFNKYFYSNASKKLEYKIQFLAYKKNVAPKPVFLDIRRQIFISLYQEGFHKTILNKSDLKTLARTLKRLHNIKLHSKVFNIKSYFKKNTKIFNSELKNVLLKLNKFDKDLVLCHNDLNPENILFSKNTKLIDWEFAAINDRYFDLCCIIIEFNLSIREEHFFLNQYFKNKKANKNKLKAYKIIYKHICKIWFDIISKKGIKCQKQF